MIGNPSLVNLEIPKVVTQLELKNIFEESINIIDDKSCELTVDNKTSITEIITKFNQSNINVIDILSKRNKLEELFIELTQK